MEPQNYLQLMPPEILTKIFSFLPRRERFICMCMCPRWKDAMDVPCLWKHMSVKLDVDFFEVSTIQLTLEYCKYVKSLELRFEYPEEPMQWINYKMMDITKRMYRFLSIFVNKNLQIHRLSFNNFCDFYRSKKILYYLSMFLRSQYKIKTISFNGSYFSKKALIKVLSSSIAANHSSIKYLDIQNSYYEHDFHVIPSQYNVLSSQLMTCITSVDNLLVLKIDLECLIGNGVLDGFVNSKCKSLAYLDIRIAEHDLTNINTSQLYTINTWNDMIKKFKELKVSITFYDVISYYDTIEKILNRAIPLHYVSWISETSILKDLYMLALNRFCTTLEYIKITARNETLDELLTFAVQTCKDLCLLEFSGVINDLVLMQENFELSSFSGFRTYKMHVKNYKLQKITFSNERVPKLNSENSLSKLQIYEI